MSLIDIDIQITVIIVIKQCCTGAHYFDQVHGAMHSVKVSEIQP